MGDPGDKGGSRGVPRVSRTVSGTYRKFQERSRDFKEVSLTSRGSKGRSRGLRLFQERFDPMKRSKGFQERCKSVPGSFGRFQGSSRESIRKALNSCGNPLKFP